MFSSVGFMTAVLSRLSLSSLKPSIVGMLLRSKGSRFYFFRFIGRVVKESAFIGFPDIFCPELFSWAADNEVMKPKRKVSIGLRDIFQEFSDYFFFLGGKDGLPVKSGLTTPEVP